MDTSGNTYAEKTANQGARTVLGGNASWKIDQVGILKDICKALTKPMVVNSLNYDPRKKGKPCSKRRMKNLFEIPLGCD